jgi:hypothetical protein
VTRNGASLARRAITAVEHADARFFGDDVATIVPVLQRLAGMAAAKS